MASEVEFWRQDPATKAEGIAREVERLSRQARAAGADEILSAGHGDEVRAAKLLKNDLRIHSWVGSRSKRGRD